MPLDFKGIFPDPEDRGEPVTAEEIKDKVDTTLDNLDIIEGKVVTLDGKVVGVADDVGVVDGKIVSVASDIGDVSTDISTLDGKVVTVDNKVVTATTNIATLDGKVVTVDGKVVDAADSIAVVDGKVVIIDNNVDTLLAGAAVIESIQYKTVNIGNGDTSDTVAITSVEEDNTVILLMGQYASDTGSDSWDNVFGRVELTSDVLITAYRGASTDTSLYINMCIIEFAEGVLSSKQTGTIVMTGSSNTKTITSVDTSKAAIFYAGSSNTVTSTDVEDCDDAMGRIALTNSTTLTASRQGITDECTVGYQIVEFN